MEMRCPSEDGVLNVTRGQVLKMVFVKEMAMVKVWQTNGMEE